MRAHPNVTRLPYPTLFRSSAWPGKISNSPAGSTTAAERGDMVADVAFDAPIAHPFSYRVPEGLTVTRGQRVLASRESARAHVRTPVTVAPRVPASAAEKIV